MRPTDLYNTKKTATNHTDCTDECMDRGVKRTHAFAVAICVIRDNLWPVSFLEFDCSGYVTLCPALQRSWEIGRATINSNVTVH